MTRPSGNPLRGCVFVLPPALVLWVMLIGLIAVGLAVTG